MNRANVQLGSSSSFIMSGFEVIYFLICLDLSTLRDFVGFESLIHFSKTFLMIKSH